MKKAIFIAFATLLFISCGSDVKEQKYMGISGNPKTVKDTRHEATEKFGEAVEQEIYEVLSYEFDGSGYVKKMAHYNDDGNAVYTITNKFENGKCVESKVHQKYNDISTTNTIKERTSKKEVWERKTSDGRITTSHIEHGNLKSTTIIKDSDGNTVSKTERRFDSKGNVLEFKRYSEKDVVYWTKSIFDDDSREIEKKMLDGSDDCVYTYKYDSFDKKGNWTKRFEYKDGDIEYITIRKINY
jgi:hypothetical protein